MDFSEVLLNFRSKHGLTQVDLSKIIGVNYGVISRWEIGKNKPRPTTRIKILKKMEEYENGQ